MIEVHYTEYTRNVSRLFSKSRYIVAVYVINGEFTTAVHKLAQPLSKPLVICANSDSGDSDAFLGRNVEAKHSLLRYRRKWNGAEKGIKCSSSGILEKDAMVKVEEVKDVNASSILDIMVKAVI